MGAGSKVKSSQSGPPKMRPDKAYINPGDDDQMELTGYKRNYVKTAVVWFFIIITVGFLRLFFYWLNHLFVKATHSECQLIDATRVLLQDQWKQWFVADIKDQTTDTTIITLAEISLSSKDDIPSSGNISKLRFFMCKKSKYIWDPEQQMYFRLRGLEKDLRCSFFHNQKGLSFNEQLQAQLLYGSNAIRVHVTPIIIILVKEVLTPFYVFQVFSVCVWYSDSYYIYATCIIAISVLSITVTVYQTRKMQRALRSTIDVSNIVTVRRREDMQDIVSDIVSDDLMPGDVIEIPRRGCMMACDAVLITGNCILNESMLTGESVPVTKTPLPNPVHSTSSDVMFDMKLHSRHVLFSGTQVIQTRFTGQNTVTAVVIRTGFMTSKGELVRAILYPKPMDFKFNRHTYWFIAVLALVACLGFIYTIILMIDYGDSISDIIIRSLDLLTIAVPPALPAALSVGIVFSQRRLKQAGIYCISPNGINISGTINVVCFDKTGTLTEDGMKLMCVAPSPASNFTPEVRDMEKLQDEKVIRAMASCHSLAIIEGEVIGDPLDLIMFNATDSSFEEPGPEDTRFGMVVPTVVTPRSMKRAIGVVRQFPFSSALQRMSVLTRSLGQEGFELYSKGAPETIVKFCKKETVPVDFQDVLMRYTTHGYRVIALAWRPVAEQYNITEVQRITRDQVEKGLHFLGLVVMENSLKPETTPVIHTLRDAAIRTVMVTGDNMLTALSVAVECDMIDRTDRVIMVQAYPAQDEKSQPQIEFMYTDNDRSKLDKEDIMLDMEDNPKFHFAVSGTSWEVIRQEFPDLLTKLAVKGAVFARMGPDQKAQLVECLQSIGYYVGMCGDGANDCGALKTAHTGVSLSEAEASVASPFTSKKPTIECVPNLIREGRAALVTSFGIFKFMACYSLTQFVSVMILYWIGANLTDPSFVFIDLWLVTMLSITFGRTAPYQKLVKEIPPFSLLAVSPILSLLTQMTIQTGAQVLAFLDIKRQAWFVPFVDKNDYNYTSYENTAVFYISAFQYIILAITFSKGAPFRRTIATNYWFMLVILLSTVSCLWLTIYPTQGLADLMELLTFPSIPYSLLFVGLAAINLFLSVLIEMYVIDNIPVKNYFSKIREQCAPTSKYKYAVIEDEIDSNPQWPRVNPSSRSLAEAFQRLDSAHQLPKDNIGSNIDILEDLIEHPEPGTAGSFSDVTLELKPEADTQNDSSQNYRAPGASLYSAENDINVRLVDPVIGRESGQVNPGFVEGDAPGQTSFDDHGKMTTAL